MTPLAQRILKLLYGDGVSYSVRSIKDKTRYLFDEMPLIEYEEAVDDAIKWLERRDYVWFNDDCADEDGYSDQVVVQLTMKGIRDAEAMGCQ
jgi:hypothetical protein